MKKILMILACCAIVNVANASIKGNGVHFDNSEEFLLAFENCTPYSPNVFDPKNMDKNDIPEEYNSIEIVGMRKDMCIFNLIMQMSSYSAYFKVVKRCKVTQEQQKKLLKAIKNVNKNKGREYLKEISSVMNQCRVIEDISVEY